MVLAKTLKKAIRVEEYPIDFLFKSNLSIFSRPTVSCFIMEDGKRAVAKNDIPFLIHGEREKISKNAASLEIIVQKKTGARWVAEKDTCVNYDDFIERSPMYRGTPPRSYESDIILLPVLWARMLVVDCDVAAALDRIVEYFHDSSLVKSPYELHIVDQNIVHNVKMQITLPTGIHRNVSIDRIYDTKLGYFYSLSELS